MIKLYLNKIKKFILDILFPIECLSCGKQNIWLCESCFKKIKLKQIDNCPVCKKQSFYGKTHEWCYTPNNPPVKIFHWNILTEGRWLAKRDRGVQMFLDGLIIAVPFDNQVVQTAIHRLKYNFIRELASPLSEILINKIKQLDGQEGRPHWLRLLFGSNLILVPVPLHKKRLRWRDFNQAEILTKKLANRLSLVVRPYILKRTKYTQPQTKLKREKRLKNIQGAFRINKEWQNKLKSTKVLLVDDVSTTGTTLNECARVLKENGTLEVWGIVLTRG